MVREKIIWQDYAFLVGTLLGSISLIPAILNPETFVPLISSIPTTVAVSIFAITQYTLKLRLSSIATSLMAIAWLFLAIFRHG